MAKKKTKKGSVAMEVGAGLAAAGAAAAAGYYFYASKDAKKHRKQAAKWAAGLQKQVIKEARQLKKIDARTVAQAVDSAVAAYEGVRSINRADLKAAARELKANWKMIQQEAKSETKHVRGRAKKVAVKARKSARTTTKRIVKKSRAKRR